MKLRLIIVLYLIVVFPSISHSQISFYDSVITDHFDGAICVHAVDLDNDGDLDVLAANRADKIAWFEHLDGVDNFGPERVIAYLPNKTWTVYFVDLDSDGDMDVISGYYSGISWNENLGNGMFGDQYVVISDIVSAKSVIAADLDNDGDSDLIAALSYTDQVVWFENLDGKGTFGYRKVIAYNEEGANSIFAADLDNDGDMDVLSSSHVGVFGQTGWYENTDGLGTFGPQNVITLIPTQIFCIYSTDLDNDGDMDVLSTSNDDLGISWNENMDGLGTFGSRRSISSSIYDSYCVTSADMDKDGDMDVISASYGDDHVFWYENIDGLGNFGSMQNISCASDGPLWVTASDLDNDGDLDILSAALAGDEVIWHRNLTPVPDPDTFLEVPLEFATIEEAIEAADPGDTILVHPGLYIINTSIVNDKVDNLLLMGSREENGSNATIISTNITITKIPMFHFSNVHSCTITGFEITNGSVGNLFENCHDCVSTGNYLHNNDIGAGIGNCENVEISYCIIDQNTDRGIGIWNSDHLDIDHNTILRSQNTEGISIGGISDSIVVKNNIFAFHNEEGIDTQGITMTYFVHDYNCFWQNTSGSINGYAIGTHSKEADPLLQDMYNENFYLQTVSPCLGSGENGTDIGALGVWAGGTNVDTESSGVITRFELHQNYPNPFNPNTIIPYSIPKASHVELSIYNLRGEKITTLINGHKTTGHYSVEWNGRNETGNSVASGIYLVRLEADSFVQTRKMLFVR